MPTRSIAAKSPTAVPLEYAGKWVAWSADHTRIVAASEQLPDLWKIVNERSIADPIFEKVPRADVRFVGMR